MSSAGYMTIATLLVAATLGGCSGNGAGLDANGNPITSGSGNVPLTADFQAIQDNVFTPICSVCHIGAGAPEGLQLDAAHSYMLIVNVASAEQPNLKRILPGDPDNSYLIQKIEGAPTISGVRMPANGPPYLPQSTIDTMRQWVTNGAPQSAAAQVAAMVKATKRFSVAATAPDNASVVSAVLPRVVVGFSGEIDSNLLNDTTVSLQKLNAIQPIDTMAIKAMAAAGNSPGQAMTAAGAMASAAASQHLPITLEVPAGNTTALVITPGTPLTSGTYRVTLRASLADMNAQALGSDFTFTFTVDALQ